MCFSFCTCRLISVCFGCILMQDVCLMRYLQDRVLHLVKDFFDDRPNLICSSSKCGMIVPLGVTC